MSDKQRLNAYSLCYVERLSWEFALCWFTTSKTPWGDDWNDVPADSNAGDPYGPLIYNMADGRQLLSRDEWHFDGEPLFTMIKFPVEIRGMEFSASERLSVEQINRGESPLISASWRDQELIVPGGIKLYDCLEKFSAYGCIVYEPLGGFYASRFPKKIDNPTFMEKAS